jgi:membrane peptidoglycan carboxypeptidase
VPVVRGPRTPSTAPNRHHAVRIVTLRAASRHHRQPTSRAGTLIAVALAIVLGASATGIAVFGLAATATVAYLSQDLPDPSQLESLTFAQPTILYDREGKVELGRFQTVERRVMAYDDVPRLVLDATTTAEDRTFWENPGFDLPAILSAVAESASGEGERGASTITQQLVRARMLPEDAVEPGSDRYVRKAKEILQSLRLNETYPGEKGKERVISAYLNEIYYGHKAYGVAAAARVYFGITDLEELTSAQAALLAGLPKSPSTLDPYGFAVENEKGELVVPADAPPVVRRDWILGNLSSSRWTNLTDEELEAALDEPVVLAGTKPASFRAGHFAWQVERQLQGIVGDDVDLTTAGYRVITTLDWRAQHKAQRWVTAAVIAPNLKRNAGERLLETLEIPARDRAWIRALRGKDIHNAALVAIDYRTGDVLAYLGSAGYARDDLASKRFEPKYDVAGDGYRQPGSAFKPIVYGTAFEERALSAGSLLLDITTEFNARQNWAPRDADRRDRGPVLVREALQQSLNIPAIRALDRVGNAAVADRAEALGIRFQGGADAYLQSGLAGALGTVEVRPIDLTSAFGSFGNGGVHVPTRMILEVRAPDGTVLWKAPKPDRERAVSAQTAFLVSDILAGNSDPDVNAAWGPVLLTRGPDRVRRPVAAKTGTAQDARDLATYGYLAPPKNPDQPGLAVGIWMGNSDHSLPRSREPATSITAAAPLWRAFVEDLTAKWPVARFARPGKVVEAPIDAWSGGKPGRWTRETREEYFIRGTQPGGRNEIDEAGLLYSVACGGWRVDPLKAELGPTAWNRDVEDWLRRARRGIGVIGRWDSATAYLPGERSWGGPLVGPCPRPKPEPKPDKPDKPEKPDKPKPTKPPPWPEPTEPPDSDGD